MRSDSSLPPDFRAEKTWTTDPNTGAHAPALNRTDFYNGPDYHRHSYSGYEHNKFYLNVGGKTFSDLSGVSGADNIADGRSWCALDYDQDGWTDIALVNSNHPLLNLYRNRMGERSKNNHLKIRLLGGARAGERSIAWSNRDAVGAVVEIATGSRTLRRVRQLGEGYAAQTSATLTVGIGEATAAESLRVTWPSGKTTKIMAPIPAGVVLTLKERPD